ncbi:MAG: AraC family transcriptional regulator [Paenibacillus sp.]|jgi:AraC family transcriptional regulator of arabinose operon|nr:AraC family transcriptional regulator [Paenibacillus sp.]
MSNNDHTPAAEVLSAYYAYYRKPFERKGAFTFRSYYMRLQVEGQCKVLVNGKWQAMTSGDLLLFQPGEVTEFWFDPNYTKAEQSLNANYYLFCQGPWLETWWNAKKRPQKINLKLNESLLTMFKEIVLEQYQMSHDRREASDYLLRTLCIYIDRSIDTNPYLSKNQLQIAQQMKYYINKYACATFKVEDVAQHVGLKVSQASNIFKSSFGRSMIDYALEVRLHTARDQMRNTTRTLEEIAYTSGFGSYSYFHRAFRKQYGISPNNYRNSISTAQPENIAERSDSRPIEQAGRQLPQDETNPQ